MTFFMPSPIAEPQPSPLLIHHQNFVVNAVSSFIPSDHIKLGTDEETGVKIVYVDPEVKALMRGLVEENIPPANLRVDRLARSASSSEVSDALANRFACFCDLWELVKLQPRGEVGLLHADGKGNLIKVKVAVAGVVWLVSAYFDYWDDERGWHFHAYRADGSDVWREDRLVISRDSDALTI